MVEAADVASATKGALENKGLFDIQIIADINLTAMAGRYAERQGIMGAKYTLPEIYPYFKKELKK